MYLKRKVYDQLLDWKNDTVHSTEALTAPAPGILLIRL